MKQQMGFGPTNWFYEQGGNTVLTLIRKAFWPTAIVATALMLFGALGSAVNADELGDVQSSSGDDVVQAGEEVAVYVVVEGDADKDAADKAAVATPSTPSRAPLTGARGYRRPPRPTRQGDARKDLRYGSRQPKALREADGELADATDAFDFNGDGDDDETRHLSSAMRP